MNNSKEKRETIIYELINVRELKYKEEMFDLVIDAGIIDELLCWEDFYINMTVMTKEIARVLKTGGIYFIISYGKKQNWDFF